MLLNDNDKAKWLHSKKAKNILSALGSFIYYCFEKRNKKREFTSRLII